MDVAEEELGTLARKAVPHRNEEFYSALVGSLLRHGVDSVNLLEQLDREQLAGFLGAVPLASAVAGALLKVAQESTGLFLNQHVLNNTSAT